MKKFLFATHGTLAAGAKSTLELLIGNVADITCLTAYVNPRIRKKIETDERKYIKTAYGMGYQWIGGESR